MAIKQRGGVWHCDFATPDGKRVRRSLDTSDRLEAQELHDKLKSESWRVSRLGEAPQKTFEEACVRWLTDKQHKRSLDDDKTKIEFFLEHFSGRILSSIRPEEITSAVAGLKNRKSNGKVEVTNATKNLYLAFIRSLLRIAEKEWGWLEKAPNLKSRSTPNRRIRWLTREEAERMIRVMPDIIRPVVIFALSTGLRRSNIINLEWSQIDMPRKVAWINPENAKGGKAIGVALNDTACSVLRKQFGLHSRWVFVHTKAKNRADGSMTPDVRKMRVDDNRQWQKGLKLAGIEDFRFHDLRHTWASWLIQSGVPLSALQEMGGWECIEMVRRYAHLSPNHLSEHACKLDSMIVVDGTNTAQHGIDKVLKIA